MFDRIVLENIGPYSDEVVLDFTCDGRNKANPNSVIKLPDGTLITKVAGIIAGNACGKTTIVDAICSIGSYISSPLREKSFPSFSELKMDSLDEEYYDELREIYNNYSFPSINKNRKDTVGKIEVELFIVSDIGEKYSGYYNFSVKYDYEYRRAGLLEEKLTFRKKYSARDEATILFEIKNSTKSEIGYKLAYKQNILSDYIAANVDTDELEEKIKYYDLFHKQYVKNSSSMISIGSDYNEDYIIYKLKDKQELLKNFMSMADNGIQGVEIDDSDPDNEKLWALYGDYKIRYGQLSTATKKMCAFTCDYAKCYDKSGILLADELDNSLNIKLASLLINLYLEFDKKNKGQLIFTTNNPEVLNSLRRDQIYVIVKNNNVPVLTRFSEYINPETNSKVRNDFSFSKAYKDNFISNFPEQEKVNKFIDYLTNR